MPKRTTAPSPTDEEILQYQDVPIPVASKYIAMSTTTLSRALQTGRAPFGFAVQNPKTQSWSYNISPGGLVKYKHEGGQIMGLNCMMDILVNMTEQILTAKLSGLQQVLDSVIR